MVKSTICLKRTYILLAKLLTAPLSTVLSKRSLKMVSIVNMISVQHQYISIVLKHK